jgi:hypothetical protein
MVPDNPFSGKIGLRKYRNTRQNHQGKEAQNLIHGTSETRPH